MHSLAGPNAHAGATPSPPRPPPASRKKTLPPPLAPPLPLSAPFCHRRPPAQPPVPSSTRPAPHAPTSSRTHNPPHAALHAAGVGVAPACHPSRHCERGGGGVCPGQAVARQPEKGVMGESRGTPEIICWTSRGGVDLPRLVRSHAVEAGGRRRRRRDSRNRRRHPPVVARSRGRPRRVVACDGRRAGGRGDSPPPPPYPTTSAGHPGQDGTGGPAAAVTPAPPNKQHVWSGRGKGRQGQEKKKKREAWESGRHP